MREQRHFRTLITGIKYNWFWVIIILFDFNLAIADCAFVHLEKNYLFVGDELKGALYTNPCNGIFPQVIISLMNDENQPVCESWVRLDASLQPFQMNVPANIDEGLYRLVVYTPRSMEVISTRDLPVFNKYPELGLPEAGGEFVGSALNKKQEGLSVTWNQETFRPGGNFTLNIEADPETREPLFISLKITDKAQSVPDDLPPVINDRVSDKTDAIPLSSHTFAIEGYLSDSSGSGCSFCQVILTIPILENGIYYTKTDVTGSFVISGLAHSGIQKGYLSYQPDPTVSDKQFFIHERKSVINPGPGSTNFEKIKARLMPELSRSLLSAALQKVESPQLITSSEPASRPYQDMQLYPKFDTQVLFDDYHLGSDMKRTIKSIVPFVNTIKRNQLRVFSTENRSNFPEAPLILLDGIPIDNLTALSIDPRTIYKVEVLNKRRSLAQVGNLAINGVIAFFTKNGTDESKLKGVQKIYLKGFDNQEFREPFTQPLAAFSKVLYWDPSIEIESGKTFKPSIKLPDYYVELIVSIVGYDSEGNLIYYQDEIVR